MLGGLCAAYLVAQELPFLARSDDFVFDDAGVVLMAGALVCAVGVLDDIFDLDALTKLGGQVLAAGLLVALGVRFYYFPGADGTQFALDNVAFVPEPGSFALMGLGLFGIGAVARRRKAAAAAAAV